MEQTAQEKAEPKGHWIIRIAAIAVLVALAAWARYVVFRTPLGAHLRDRDFVLQWVGLHRWIAPLVLVGAYIFCTVLMLPVWPLQLASGYCFGVMHGIAWCELGAATGAVASLLLSRLLVGNWFRARYESRVEKLHKVNQTLGNNGLFVVLGVRLCHMLPFGLSNYLFGLTRITFADVFLGTLGGGLPAIGFYVVLGAGRHRDWRVWTFLGVWNALLLVPLGWRYFSRRRLKRRQGFDPVLPDAQKSTG